MLLGWQWGLGFFLAFTLASFHVMYFGAHTGLC